IFDTYLASVLIGAGAEHERHGLEAVTNRYLELQLDKEPQLSDWSRDLSEYQLEYAARDAAVLLPLREKLRAKLGEMDLLATAELEFSCILALAGMELAGIYLDSARWRELIARIRAVHDRVAEELQRELGAGLPQMNLFGAPPAIN